MRAAGCLLLACLSAARAFLLQNSAAGISRAVLPGARAMLLATRQISAPRTRWESKSLKMNGVSREVGDVLLRYGVAEADHEALIKEITPLLGGGLPGSASTAKSKIETLEISVVRGEGGGLGIDVDKSNVIQASSGQKDLKVGDRVIAIDGTPLGSKFVAQGLEPGKADYTFTIERGG